MFLEIGIILIVLWLLGFTFYPLGGLIHIILVIAVIAIIWHFITGKKIL
ncbi:MAG: hypothetical protein UR22_C0011G0007 [Parcubacteria group bacterium GW2011_GWC2_32_10]|nr:MAG: hypothetical protein UR22_C0011G0007 [Parcubacteria group bacterium GW2011_GWC2_32_10]